MIRLAKTLFEGIDPGDSSLKCCFGAAHLQIVSLALEPLLGSFECRSGSLLIDLIRPLNRLCENIDRIGKYLGKALMKSCSLDLISLMYREDTGPYYHG
jgi:hypothetical protein